MWRTYAETSEDVQGCALKDGGEYGDVNGAFQEMLATRKSLIAAEPRMRGVNEDW